MNVMRTVSIFFSVATLALTATSQSVAKLHLPKSLGQKLGLSDKPISVDQVEKIFSEITGVSNLRSGQFPQETPYDAHLIVVANGISSQSFSSMEKVDVVSVDELKNSEMLWKMFRNFEGIENNEVPASIADIFHQANPGSMHLSLSGSSEFLRSTSLHKSLISDTNAASVLVNPKAVEVQNSKISSYLNTIMNLKDIDLINREVFNGKFDSQIKPDQSFLIEFTAIKGLLNIINGNDQISSLVQDGIPDYFTISISTLEKIRSIYGTESEKYQIASSETERLVEKLISSIESSYKSATTSVISFEQDYAPVIKSRSAKRSAYDVTSPCYPDEATCLETNNNCTSHGACILVKSTAQKECWKCKCTSEYAGDMCEFEDKISVFHTMFWTSLAFAIIVLLVSMTLAYTDPGTDTLLFRTGSQRPKTD